MRVGERHDSIQKNLYVMFSSSAKSGSNSKAASSKREENVRFFTIGMCFLAVVIFTLTNVSIRFKLSRARTDSIYFQGSRTLITPCGLSGSGDQGCKPSIRIAVKKSHFLVEELVSVASADSLSNFRFGFRVFSMLALHWMTQQLSRGFKRGTWHAKQPRSPICAHAYSNHGTLDPAPPDTFIIGMEDTVFQV